MIILSTDPGKQGAVAWAEIRPAQEGRPARIIEETVRVRDIPLRTFTKADGKEVSVTDEFLYARILLEVAPDLVIMEHLSARPPIGNKKGGGSVQEWSLAEGYGGLRAAARCHFLHRNQPEGLHLVRPNHWKGAMCLSPDKNVSLERARDIFPWMSKSELKFKKNEGRAEALLLLEYYRTSLIHLPFIEVI